MKLSLNGQWKLYCLEEKKGKNPPSGEFPDLSFARYNVVATVPGNCQLDLNRAGYLPDPFFGDNYYQYVALEHCGWVYERFFSIDGFPGEAKWLNIII